MGKARSVMIQGTHSDAGKSILVTALCRILSQDGFVVAPFKSQNMALNSYVTLDGKEIGTAQGVQAEAAGTPATTDMNPILIKPSADYEAQIVVHGRPERTMKAGEYRSSFYEMGKEIIKEAYERLTEHYDFVVIEGAGSPAEVNLNDRELVNMSVAKIADAPVILVGDIDRGGVFASLVGTLQLLDSEDRKRVVGVIINKFRGDINLLEPGLDWFHEYTGVPVLGVIPYMENLMLDAEDSLSLSRYSTQKDEGKPIDIAVIQYPRISNFTDIDPFLEESDCHVRFVKAERDLGEPDLIILPGSKNTIGDLLHIREMGVEEAIKGLIHRKAVKVIGICGGYQMLGEKLEDPDGVESDEGAATGMGLLPVHTLLTGMKTTVRSKGIIHFEGAEYDITGYEIHMGKSHHSEECEAFILQGEKKRDGTKSRNGNIIGTYFHGLFHNDAFRHALLNGILRGKGMEPPKDRKQTHRMRKEEYDRIAEVVRQSLDMEKVYQMIGKVDR